jgi:hypothetical protein
MTDALAFDLAAARTQAKATAADTTHWEGCESVPVAQGV